MLLMPPLRAKLPTVANLGEPKQTVNRLAAKMIVSCVAHKRHLANIGEIDANELEFLMGTHSHDLSKFHFEMSMPTMTAGTGDKTLVCPLTPRS